MSPWAERMVDSTALRAQPSIVADGSAIVTQDFTLKTRLRHYRHRSVYLKTMSKN